jgi:hypothetical protein
MLCLAFRTAVHAKAGDAADGEMNDEDIALVAARIVQRRNFDAAHMAVSEGRRRETRGFLRVLVIPKAECVLCDHGLLFPAANQAKRGPLRVGGDQRIIAAGDFGRFLDDRIARSRRPAPLLRRCRACENTTSERTPAFAACAA